MAVSYNRLWKLLVDKKISKADLRKAAGLAPNTMTKLRRDEPVAMGVLEKICGALDADFGDIMEYIRQNPTSQMCIRDRSQYDQLSDFPTRHNKRGVPMCYENGEINLCL